MMLAVESFDRTLATLRQLSITAREVGDESAGDAQAGEFEPLIRTMRVRELARSNGSRDFVRGSIMRRDCSDSGLVVGEAEAFAAIGDYFAAWEHVHRSSLPGDRLRVRTAIIRDYLARRKVPGESTLPAPTDLIREMERLSPGKGDTFLATQWR
jgi:hypothetical protein